MIAERLAEATTARSQPPPPVPSPVEFRYSQSDSFVGLLRELGASLLVSTYQANKLLVARAAGAGLSTLVRTFDRPMGIAIDQRRLALGTRGQVWLFRNAPDIAPQVLPGLRFPEVVGFQQDTIHQTFVVPPAVSATR